MTARFLAHLSFVCRDIAPELGDHLWQSTLFALVVGLLALCLRRYKARIRYWIWLAASGKFLLPFSLQISLGSRVGLSSQTKEGMYAALDDVSQPFTELTARDMPKAQLSAISAAPYRAIEWLPILLTALWMCGFFGMLIFWWLQWRQIALAKREAKPLREGREIAVLRKVEFATRTSKPVRVLLSQGTTEPGIFGFLRPTLLWPTGLSQHMEDAHLEAVLAHEVCHVRHRDNLTSLIQMLVKAVFWFHPVVWWLESRLVKERERACDEEVLLLGKPQMYAESILKVCEFCVGSPLVCLSGVTGADLKKRVIRLASERVGADLSRTLKVALAGLTLVAVAGPVAYGLAHGVVPVYGQILHASDPLPSFEVTTIKPLKPGEWPPPFQDRPDVLFMVGPIEQWIGFAYNLPPFSSTQIAGAPNWLGSDMYEVQGKIESSTSTALQKMRTAQQQQQKQLMMQSLLANRMKLKVHFEIRQVPMYAPVVAKYGHKLHPAKEAPQQTDTMLPPPLAPGAKPTLDGLRKGAFAMPTGTGFVLQAKALTVNELAQMLQTRPDVGGRLIVNQTGISGFYDCTMKWSRLPSAVSLEKSTASDSDEPTFFTAIQEQLGLKLVPTKGPAEVIVIDHIERPSEN